MRNTFFHIRIWSLTGSLILVLGIFTPLMAQGTPEEKIQIGFAQKLFNESQFADAAQGFKDFIVDYPTSDRLAYAMLQLGKAYERSGQYQQATEAFQQFIERNPNHLEVPAAMRSKAHALDRLGKYTKAGVAFQDVHTSYPEGEYATQDLLDAGKNYHRGRVLDRAEATFLRLIAQYPQSPLIHEAIYNLGLVLQEANRSEEALAQFQTIADYSGATERKPNALLEMGKIALAQEKFQAAEDVFARLRKQFSKSASAETSYLVLANWYASRNNWERAEATYANAQSNLPRNTRRQQAVLGKAHAQRMLEKFDDALGLYSQFLKVYPKSPFLPAARLGFARAFADLKNYRNALEAFNLLLENFPDAEVSIEAYSDIGNIWRQLGNPQKALSAYQIYESKIQSSEHKASARLRIAQVYERDLKWYDFAAESYRTLLKNNLEQYVSQGQFGLARTFEQQGQHNLALREYRTYLKNFADGSQAQEAETRIRYLREFAPTTPLPDNLFTLIAGLPVIASSPESQFHLGRHLYQNRNYQQAAERFQAALSGGEPPPFAAEVTYFLAESYRQTARKVMLEGRKEEAPSWRKKGIQTHQTVLAQFPKSDWADDSQLVLIETELALVTPDTTRARQMLEAYGKFQKTYANSNRLDQALLGTADAHYLAGQMDLALKAYSDVKRKFPEKERAAFGIGLCQAQQKDFRQAEETLRTFLFDHPQSDLADQARFHLGRILMDREFYSSAAEEFSEVLSAPSSLKLERSARSFLAECYFRLGDYQQAIQIDKSLLKRGGAPDLLRRLARSYFSNNQHGEAVQAYSVFLRFFPDAADADSIAFTRAERLAFLNRIPEAISAFQELSKKYPNSPLRHQADQSVGDLLFKTQKYADALNVYHQIPPTSRNESIAGQEVLSLYRLKRVKEAQKMVKTFKKSHKTATDWVALFEVEEGKYKLRLQKPKDARKIFEKIIKNYPKSEAEAEASYYLVRAFFLTPDKDGNNEPYFKALVSFVETFSHNPHWSSANLELAEYWEHNEEYGRAARTYQNALENGLAYKKRPGVINKIVESYKNLKLYEQAIGYARRLVNEFPQHKLTLESQIDIGEMLFYKGDYRQSIQELTPLLTQITDPNRRASVQHTIADNFYNLEDFDNARKEFLKLRYHEGGTTMWIATAYYRIADCYEAQGEYKQAIEELEEIQIRFGASSNYGAQAGPRIQKLRAKLNRLPGR